MTPRSGSAPVRVRFFSLDEANRTLPLVRRIARDIRDEYRELQPRLRELDRLRARGDAAAEADALEQDLGRRTARMNGYLAELLELGCHFKGFEEGLVDFHSLYHGQPVLLCWKLGESEVGHWHELDGGFAGRQPIAPEDRAFFESDRS